jgi:hypothetical protein
VVDILQVLEGATYAAFIVGAIVAVYELRTMSRDRRLEMSMRFNEHWCSKDFEEAFTKIRGLSPEDMDPRQIEEKCTQEALWMVVDYVSGIGDLYYEKSVDRRFVFNFIAWDLMWQKLKPWVIDMREKTGNPYIGFSLENCAKEERRRAAGEKGHFPNPWKNAGKGV